jgi:hypothetical protein
MSLNSSKYASGFSPQNIPGLTIWLDAADSNAVTQSGGAVSYWRDKSPNGLDMSQNTVAAQPTYESNVQNGRPAIRFTTTQNIQTTSNVTLPPDQTWFVSFNVIASNSFFFFEHGTPIQTVQGSYLLSANNGLFGVNRGSPIRTIYDVSAGSAGQNTIISFNTWYIASLVNSNLSGVASNDIYWSLNGAARATEFYSGANPVYSATATATNKLYLNFRSGGSNYVGELLIYNRALTRAEVRLTERYLAQKWGITLPTAHPYFSIPATMRQFNPLDISGCSLWLDAGDPTTLTLSGSNVTQWADKSGNANNAVTSSRFAWLGPTVTSSNSLKFTRVAGTSVQMLRTQTGRQTTSDVTYTVVVKPYNDVTSGYTIDLRKTSDGQALVDLGDNATFFRGSTSAFYSMTTPYTPLSFNIITLQAGVNKYATYLNGTLAGSATSTLDMPAADAAYTTIGAITDLNYGANATAATQILYTMTSEFYEVIMFNAYLTRTQIQQIELYLAEKWGLRSILSTANPLRLYESLSPVFNPTLFSNCAVWLDAMDSTSVTITSGTVSKVNDKSGNNVNLSNATGFTYPNNTFNGRYPSFLNVNQDGTTKLGENASYTVSQPITTFFVGKKNTSRNWYDGYIFDGITSRVAIYGAAYTMFAGGSISVTQTESNLIHSGVFNTTSSSNFINGTLGAAGGIGTNSLTGLRIGNSVGNADPWMGHFCEFILYTGALSSDRRRLIEGYLAWKWGLVGSLPSTHPYKKTPV